MVRGDTKVYVGNLSSEVTEELLHELFLQAGPVAEVNTPHNDGARRKPFAFVSFKHSCSVPYAISLLDGIKLFDQPIRVAPAHGSDYENAMYNSSGPPGLVVQPPPVPIQANIQPPSNHHNDLRHLLSNRSRHADFMMPSSARSRGRDRSPSEKCLDAIPDLLNALDWLYSTDAQQGPQNHRNMRNDNYHDSSQDRRHFRNSRDSRNDQRHHQNAHHSHRDRDRRDHRPYSQSHSRRRF